MGERKRQSGTSTACMEKMTRMRMKSAFWALPLLFVTAAAQLQLAENEQNVVTVKPVDGFVQVYNGEFVIVQEDNSSERTFCEPFYLVGWNSWDVTRVPRLLNSVGQQFLTQQLETAASSGLNVIRAWAHTVDPDYPVMKGPGEYDEFGRQLEVSGWRRSDDRLE